MWLIILQTSNPSITKEEARAPKELREDQSRAILAVDKGVAMVVLAKQDYTNKTLDLYLQRDSYRLITADLSKRHKNKVINLLRTIKVQSRLGDNTYKPYPTGAVPLNFMDFQK